MPTAIFCPVASRISLSVDKVKSELGVKAIHREVAEAGGTHTLREPSEAYAGDFASESDALRPGNTILREKNTDHTET